MNCPDFIRLLYVVIGTYSSYFSEVRRTTEIHVKRHWPASTKHVYSAFTKRYSSKTEKLIIEIQRDKTYQMMREIREGRHNQGLERRKKKHKLLEGA